VAAGHKEKGEKGAPSGAVRAWLWRRTGWELLATRKGARVHSDFVRDLAFTPDGLSLVAADGSGHLKVYDQGDTPRLQFVFPGSGVAAAALSPEGLTAAAICGADGAITWTALDGRHLHLGRWWLSKNGPKGEGGGLPAPSAALFAHDE